MAEKIAFASDHGGFDLKNALIDFVKKQGFEALDLGTFTTESVDYPDIAVKMADAIKNGTVSRGVLLCGTGIGISIAANRFRHVRAALVHDAFGARLCRQHNNANVLVLGGRTTGPEVACDCVNIFLNTDFEGGRHERRVNKLGILGKDD